MLYPQTKVWGNSSKRDEKQIFQIFEIWKIFNLTKFFLLKRNDIFLCGGNRNRRSQTRLGERMSELGRINRSVFISLQLNNIKFCKCFCRERSPPEVGVLRPRLIRALRFRKDFFVTFFLGKKVNDLFCLRPHPFPSP